MMTRPWIFATLVTGIVACSSNGRDGPTLGSPGVGVARVDPDSDSGHLDTRAEGGNGGVSEDAGVDVPEE